MDKGYWVMVYGTSPEKSSTIRNPYRFNGLEDIKVYVANLFVPGWDSIEESVNDKWRFFVVKDGFVQMTMNAIYCERGSGKQLPYPDTSPSPAYGFKTPMPDPQT